MNIMRRYTLVCIVLLIISVAIVWYRRQGEQLSIASPDMLGEAQIASPGWPIIISPTPVPDLTLGRIFSSDHSWHNNIPKEELVTMIATGDVIPARSVNDQMVKRKNFCWPFEKTAGVLSSADLTIINLETPLLKNCKPTNQGMIFCGDARVVEGLVFAGVDVATLGNNHAGNYYGEGIVETKRILQDAGIQSVDGSGTYRTVKGITFAFLSYNDIGAPEEGIPWADEIRIVQDVARTRQEADIVVVSFHWGVEYVTTPTSRQRELAHLSIDAGADVILGNHPHWIQPIELYKDKFIIYAHGNFVFDQEWSEETKLGLIGRYTFYDKKLVDVEFVPVRIVDYGQPYFLEGEETIRVLNKFEQASIELAGQ